MARKLTRAAALENRAFLRLLRRTGNVRLACRELGLKYGTMQDRRRKHSAFAARWDAALVFFQPRIKSGAPARTLSGPSAKRRSLDKLGTNGSSGFRTAGGEMVMVRLKNGRVQMRRAQAGKLTPAAEQAFLAAVSATCNLSLAAAAVGSCFKAFDRRRKKDPAFARELRLALRQGYDALEMALFESALPGSHEHDDWRRNDPPAVPPMSVSQALQLMYLHQKEARLLSEPGWLKRRRGESRAAHSERLTAMAEERDRRAREAFAVAEAERLARGEPAWGPAGEALRQAWDGLGPSTAFGGPRPLQMQGRIGPGEEGASRGANPRDVGRAPLGGPAGRSFAGSSTEARLCAAKPPFCSAAHGLPDLAQVTGWSRADPGKVPHHPERALFGGWRLEEMERERRARRMTSLRRS